jgi:hypothetical protein
MEVPDIADAEFAPVVFASPTPEAKPGKQIAITNGRITLRLGSGTDAGRITEIVHALDGAS